MPFFWPEFWQAVSSWPDCAIVGYQRALTHYWFHLHCAGLPDDSEKLRRICVREKDEWSECMELIFDNEKFFKQASSGLWHQKREDEEWRRCQLSIKQAAARSKAGNMARWGNAR